MYQYCHFQCVMFHLKLTVVSYLKLNLSPSYFSNVQCDSILNVSNFSKVAKGVIRNLNITVSHHQVGLLKIASASSHP